MPQPIRTSSLCFVLTLCGIAACGDDAETPTPTQDAAADASAGDGDSGDVPDASETPADSGPSGDACTPFEMPADCTIPSGSALPSSLACTGLYADFAARTPGCDVLPYTPAYTLYSDAAEKSRFVRIPRGSTIDGRDPNALVFPVGTQFWKEFRVGPAQRLGETRLIQKSARGWIYTSYVWSEDGSSATQMNDGVRDLFGTGHDVPTRDQCNDCHVGRTDFVLGWDGFSLGTGALGLTAADLRERGLFAAGQELTTYDVPGDATARAALSYLHMNCGVSCHNPNAKAKGRDSGLMLRLEVADLAGLSPAERTGIDRAPSDDVKLDGLTIPEGGYVDIAPGDPLRSLLLARMKIRGTDGQMPRVGTNVVDAAGVAAVEAWINAL